MGKRPAHVRQVRRRDLHARHHRREELNGGRVERRRQEIDADAIAVCLQRDVLGLTEVIVLLEQLVLIQTRLLGRIPVSRAVLRRLYQSAPGRRRRASDRHCGSPSKQGRPDGRTGKNRPRAQETGPGRAACHAAGARFALVVPAR